MRQTSNKRQLIKSLITGRTSLASIRQPKIDYWRQVNEAGTLFKSDSTGKILSKEQVAESAKDKDINIFWVNQVGNEPIEGEEITYDHIERPVIETKSHHNEK